MTQDDVKKCRHLRLARLRYCNESVYQHWDCNLEFGHTGSHAVLRRYWQKWKVNVAALRKPNGTLYVWNTRTGQLRYPKKLING